MPNPTVPDRRLAWIGAPPPALAAVAAHARRFDDSDDFLLSDDPFGQSLYVVDLSQRGVSALDLIRLIRRRSTAGLVALSSAPHTSFVQALQVGADVAIDRDGPSSHVEASIEAVSRRVDMTSQTAGVWKLLEQKGQLITPDSRTINLSRSDFTVLKTFAEAQGKVVPRRELTEQLWGSADGTMDSALQAALYRLRKRMDQAGQPFWPLHAVSGVGYEFRAPLAVS